MAVPSREIPSGRPAFICAPSQPSFDCFGMPPQLVFELFGVDRHFGMSSSSTLQRVQITHSCRAIGGTNLAAFQRCHIRFRPHTPLSRDCAPSKRAPLVRSTGCIATCYRSSEGVLYRTFEPTRISVSTRYVRIACKSGSIPSPGASGARIWPCPSRVM